MTRRRFYAPPTALSLVDKTVKLDRAETRHLCDVLRQRPGDHVFVFDGHGNEFRCLVMETTAHTGLLALVEAAVPARPESPLKLTLGVALLKGEKFDLVVQKAAELGVVRIIPILTERADVRISEPGGTARRIERRNRLALEAAKQSGRALVPPCQGPVKFSELAAREAVDATRRFMFTERDGAGFDTTPTTATDAIALVGPEGGWSDEELELARANEWTLVTLGGRILRAETAAITVAALMQHRYGDLR